MLVASVFLLVGAMTASAVPLGRPAGVLLGLSGEARTRTLWLVTEDQRLVLRARVPGIVVPHGDDLCRLVTAAVPTPHSGAPELGSYVHMGVAVDCGRGLSKPSPQAVGCVGTESLKPLFVTGTHLAVNYSSWSDCYQHINSDESWSVIPLEGLVGQWLFDCCAGLPTGALTEPTLEQVRQALRAECMKILHTVPPDLATDPERRPKPEICSDIEPGQWAFVHENGQWKTLARSWRNLGLTWSGWQWIEVSVLGEVPSKLVAENLLAVPWSEVSRRVPDALDAFSSPDGAVVIVVARTRILSGVALGGHLENVQKIVDTEGEERVVSVEWAAGVQVARWSQTLAERRMPDE